MDRLRKRLAGSRFARDTGWSMIIKLAARGLGFLITVLLARTLGADGYGVYVFALAIATTLSLPAQAGLPALVVRETAKGRALDEPGHVRGIWVWTGRAVGVLSTILVIGASVFLFVLNDGDLGERSSVVIWAFLLVPLAALGNLRGAALRGLNRVTAGQLPEFILRPGFFLLLVWIFVLATASITPAQAMAIHVVAAALAFAVGAWLLWQATPDAVRKAKRVFETRAWLRSAFPLALIAGIATVSSQADIIMLGIWEPSSEIGIYRVAAQIAAMAAFGLQAVNVVVAPRFASLYAKDDLTGLQRLATSSARLTLFLSVSAAVILVVVGRPFIELAYGPEFSDSYLPLVIMLGGQLVNAATGSGGHLLNMTGSERDSARAIALSTGLNIALNVALIPSLGVVGAAIATAAALIVQNLWFWLMVKRRLGVNSAAFSFKRESI